MNCRSIRTTELHCIDPKTQNKIVDISISLFDLKTFFCCSSSYENIYFNGKYSKTPERCSNNTGHYCIKEQTQI